MEAACLKIQSLTPPNVRYFIAIILIILATVLISCRFQPVQTIFESNQKDVATDLNAKKIYILKKHARNADFNYLKLNNIDFFTETDKSLMAVFNPVGGNFNYYQFLATFKGKGYNHGNAPLIKEFHNVLIIKTDRNNKIIDAFHYTLEWAEPPFQYCLFKSSTDNVILTDNLEISQLKFIRTYSWSENNKEMKESGIIKIESLEL